MTIDEEKVLLRHYFEETCQVFEVTKLLFKT